MADGCNDETRSTVGGPRERRNTLWLECYQVVVRVGWIFKTETIIMPAVLDAVVDSGLLRGLLPVLNRGGQSLPPLAFASVLARRPVKKWTLVRTTLAMAACFAVLAAVWQPLQATRPDILAGVFLMVYAAFSSANGLTQLAAAALQGKLIAPWRRCCSSAPGSSNPMGFPRFSASRRCSSRSPPPCPCCSTSPPTPWSRGARPPPTAGFTA
ncbi:MAG: hypothetical protein LW698_04750 [Planctomycetaceae bacterium]|nr:hypothetical protein [Planctomycetaceae bacterium]